MGIHESSDCRNQFLSIGVCIIILFFDMNSTVCFQRPSSIVLILSGSFLFRFRGLWHHGQHLFMKFVHLVFLAWLTHDIEVFRLSLFNLLVVPCVFSARVPGNVFRASVYRGRDRLLLCCCSSFILLWIFLFSP